MCKQGAGISHSKGLQQLQLIRQFPASVIQRHGHVDMYPGCKILLSQRTSFVQFPAKSLDILFPHGKPRRHGVPSELRKISRRLRHGIIHMVALYGTSGALHAFLSPGEEKHRMIVPFPDSSCDNSRQALMYLRQKNQHHLILFHVMLLNIPLRFLYSLHGQAFAAVVQLLQLLRRPHGLSPASALQKLQRPSGRIQPPRSVQAGADNKAQMIGVQPFRLHPVDLHQGPETLIPGVSQAP